MNEPSKTQVVRAMKVDDDKGFERVAQAIAAPCARDVTELVTLLHGEKEEDGQKAAAVLIALGPHAFPTLLAQMGTDKPADYVWEAQLLADMVAGARGQLVAKLEQMLADERDVPMPDMGPGVEEQFQPRRVRDEAYLLLRKLLNTQESEDDRYLEERAFLGRSNKERDLEISRWKQTREWVPLMER